MTLEQSITEHLTQQILDQHLRPGEHIVAETVAAALDVSRVPIREALRNLAGNGLVELRPNRGAFVTSIGIDRPDLVIGLIEVRSQLEPWAAALAAARHDAAQLAALDAILDAGAAALRHQRRREINLAHHRFLRALATMAHHDTLDAVLAPLHHRTLLAFTSVAVKVHAHGWDAHRAIRDAIAARDPVAAQRLIDEHLQQMLAAVRVPGNLVAATDPHVHVHAGGPHS